MKSDTGLKPFIAERVRYLRKQKKLSQESLSILADLEPKYINKVENLKYNIKVDTLEKIIGALDMDLASFFDFQFTTDSHELGKLIQTIQQIPDVKQKQVIESLNQLLEDLTHK